MRSFLLVFLCFCVAIGGTATAMPMSGATMGVTTAAMAMSMPMSMDVDCPDRAQATVVPSAHDDATSPHDRPDCCRTGSCECVSAHAAFTTCVCPRCSRGTTFVTVVAEAGGRVYASPALARLVRPPIS